jgi:hypothetical protein
MQEAANLLHQGVSSLQRSSIFCIINPKSTDTIQPSGNIVTGTPQLSPSSPESSAVYQVPTDGIWLFQIGMAQQQEMARSIAGQPRQAAIDQLMQRRGIKGVTITTSGSIGTALPTSSGNIKFTIVQIPDLK